MGLAILLGLVTCYVICSALNDRKKRKVRQ